MTQINDCYYIGTQLDSGTTILYAGEHVDTQDISIDPHIHGHYDFSFFTLGQTEVQVENETLLLKPGDLLIVKPGYEHSITAETDTWGIYYLGIGKIAPPNLDKVISGFKGFVLHKFQPGEYIMPRIVAEMKNRKLGMQLALGSLVNQLLIETARRIQPRARERRAPSQAVGLARLLIDRDGRHNMDLNDLARRCCISKSRLTHIFTAENGVTLSQYLRSVLMHRAARLLVDECSTVAEISAMLGYPSPQYFHGTFKKFWGCSPTEYRKIFRKS